jgi:hypothetical protein
MKYYNIFYGVCICICVCSSVVYICSVLVIRKLIIYFIHQRVMYEL